VSHEPRFDSLLKGYQPEASPRSPTEKPPPSMRKRFGGGAGGRAVGKGRLKPGDMNKTETRYADRLEAMLHAHEIRWWRFEGLKFRLSDGAWYTPDFNVLTANGDVECHEVKGHWEEAARVRIKVAADQYPFRFVACTEKRKKDGGGWNFEVFE